MRTKLTALIVVGLLALASCTSNLAGIAKSSNFIFSGTVIRIDSTRIDTNVRPKTALVSINEIILGDSSCNSLKGKQITIRTKKVDSLHVGDEGTFFTKDWFASRGQETVEAGYMAGERSTKLLKLMKKGIKLKNMYKGSLKK